MNTGLISFLFLAIIIVLLYFVWKRLKKVSSQVEATVPETRPLSAGANENVQIYESKDVLPKLPRNETLYQIIKNDKLNANLIPFDLYYVMDEVASLLRKDLQSDAVELLFDIAPDIEHGLLGSPKRLSRVLINLIENAILYSERGVIVVKIEKTAQNDHECHLRFTISDQGRGMEQATVTSLYKDPEERKEGEEKGLGFYVAKVLVASEKGTIVVKSTPGEGTRVSFELPFKIQKKQEKKLQVPSESCAEITVAVAQNNEQSAQLLASALQPYVGEVQTFVDREPAENVERYTAFDMVIIDHNLNSQALAHVLKSEGIWLIETRSILEKPSENGGVAVDYLISKPFTREYVVEMLTVFYGAKTLEAGEEAVPATEAIYESFISDSEIPVAKNISKKDFERFGGARVLIVEDNPINQRVIRGLLGDSGIELHFAENGLKALDAVQENAPFDLVLMDINMPELDGIETTRRIRNDAQYDTMPVVAFTGLNIQEQIDRMREAGMNAHMAKPLNIGRVYSIFSHYLKKYAESDRDH